MKILIHDTDIKPAGNGLVEINLRPEDLLNRIQELAGKEHSCIRFEFTKYASGDDIAEAVTFYNGATGFGKNHQNVADAMEEFEKISGPAAFRMRAERLRIEAEDLEQKAANWKAVAA